MLNVFVSFSEANTWMVDSLERMADTLGVFRLYRFDHDPQPGVQLPAKVKDAIRRADLVLVLLTQAGNASTWVQQEIGIADASNRFIVPVVEKGVSVKGILEGREHIRLDPSEPASGLVRAARAMEKLARLRAAKSRAARGQAVAVGVSLVAVLAGLMGLNGANRKS